MKHNYKWLDRRVAKPGPFLTLVLSPEELVHALRGMTKEYIAFPSEGALCTTLTHDKTKQQCAVISVSKHSQENCSAIEMAGLLVHEAVHVWQGHAAWMGERHPGVEQEAYAIQGIAQELMAEYARRIQ
jgi:hypothetical protein